MKKAEVDMLHVTVERGTAPIDAITAAALREWVESDGEAVVLAELGTSRLSLARLVGRLPVHATTRAAALAALARRRP